MYLESVYRYLVQRKYFRLVRKLLEEKVPPLYDVVLSPPNSLSETLLQLIQHPLRLIIANNEQAPKQSQCVPSSLISKECANLILSSFVEEILVPKYSKTIQLFVIPCLANSLEFPFPHLLQYLSNLIVQEYTDQPDTRTTPQIYECSISNISDRVFDSTFLFHSFLTLDLLYLDRISNAVWSRNYINVLGKLAENIRKLQQRSSHSLFKQYDMDFEGCDDIVSDEDEDTKIDTISSAERDCLLEAITQLNQQKRVDLILDNIDNYLEDVQMLYSLCKICHNLMLYHRTAVFEYRYTAFE